VRQCATYQKVVGKGGWCIGLTTLPPSCVDCVEVLGASTPSNPKGLSRLVMGQLCTYGPPGDRRAHAGGRMGFAVDE